LNAQDLLLGRFEDQPGTTLVMDSCCDDTQLLSNLQSKGYRPLVHKKYGKTTGVYVYYSSWRDCAPH
jgi:hypothetical protein